MGWFKKIFKRKNNYYWVDYKKEEGVSFLIRNKNNINIKNSTYVEELEKYKINVLWNVFNDSIIDWKGIEDEKGRYLICNEINKKLIFDYYQEIFIFIINKYEISI